MNRAADAPNAQEAALQRTLEAMTPAGVALACRAIRAGDEAGLLPEEAVSIASTRLERRRASGAARLAVRSLLRARGIGACAIPRAPSGEPIWPEGWTGSLAHDPTWAVAALGRLGEIGTLGIDVEPADPLPDDILALVVRPDDRLPASGAPLDARLVFSAKEAVYKATFPLHRRVLDYDDIAIDLPRGLATTRTGHAARLFYRSAPCIVTLAVVVP